MEWSLLQHGFHCSASALLLLQYRVDHRDAAVGRLVLLPPQCIDACGCNPRLSSPAAVKTKGTVSHPSCPQVSTARIGANIAASLAISISKCSKKKLNILLHRNIQRVSIPWSRTGNERIALPAYFRSNEWEWEWGSPQFKKKMLYLFLFHSVLGQCLLDS